MDTSAKQRLSYHGACFLLPCVCPVLRRVISTVKSLKRSADADFVAGARVDERAAAENAVNQFFGQANVALAVVEQFAETVLLIQHGRVCAVARFFEIEIRLRDGVER